MPLNLVFLVLEFEQVVVAFRAQPFRIQLYDFDLPLVFADLSRFSVECLHRYPLLLFETDKLLGSVGHTRLHIVGLPAYLTGFVLDLVDVVFASIKALLVQTFLLFLTKLLL